MVTNGDTIKMAAIPKMAAISKMVAISKMTFGGHALSYNVESEMIGIEYRNQIMHQMAVLVCC